MCTIQVVERVSNTDVHYSVQNYVQARAHRNNYAPGRRESSIHGFSLFFFRHSPFRSQNKDEVDHMTLTKEVHIPSAVSPEMSILLLGLLEKDITKREPVCSEVILYSLLDDFWCHVAVGTTERQEN